MFAMIRKWLRAWLGIDAIDSRIFAGFQDSVTQSKKIGDLEGDILMLKHQREIREGRRIQVVDWEQLQAEFAANPDNYKES